MVCHSPAHIAIWIMVSTLQIGSHASGSHPHGLPPSCPFLAACSATTSRVQVCCQSHHAVLLGCMRHPHCSCRAAAAAAPPASGDHCSPLGGVPGPAVSLYPPPTEAAATATRAAAVATRSASLLAGDVTPEDSDPAIAPPASESCSAASEAVPATAYQSAAHRALSGKGAARRPWALSARPSSRAEVPMLSSQLRVLHNR
jgi:hypothetical protein